MLFRQIKNEFKNKNNIIIVTFAFLLLLFVFLTIKNEIYYHSFNYIQNYISYYVREYLNGNSDRLFLNEVPLIYIEGNLKNIMSALYIYVATFGTTICQAIFYIFPIIIFHNITRKLYSEINNGFCISNLTRLDSKKYYSNIILKNGILSGFILIIPKLLYFLILILFFPAGQSSHVITETTFLQPGFIYNAYNYSPYLMIGMDFIITFLYGFFISSFSIIIITFTKNKPLSYLLFAFVFSVLSLVQYIFGQIPIIYYYSIYGYAASTTPFNILIPVVKIIGFTFVTSLFAKIIIGRKIRNYL